MHSSKETQSHGVTSDFARGSARRRYRVLQFLVGGALGAAWRSLKNFVRVLIGRNTYFDEKGLFLRQYVLHVTGLRPMRKITCTGLRSEGAGSQALMVMNAINFARSFGLTYVHTPFTLIQHAERPMEEWAMAWETLFNLGAGEAVCEIERRDVTNFSYNFTDLDLCFEWRCRWNELADRFRAMVAEFRRKYYLNKSPRKTDDVTVAVHVRRGDVSAADPAYFTSNETISQTIAQMKSILSAQKAKCSIRVYSQGDSADFSELSLPGVELFLNVDAVWTMQELIEADILIMARGCFSYYAALMSDGIKILEPEEVSGNDLLPSWKWRSVPPAESWIPCRANGSFDSAVFERQLSILIQEKATTATKQ